MSFAKIIDFLTVYDVLILPALFVSVWIFGFINWGKNVYRRQNKLLDACRANVLRNPRFTGIYIATVPEEYRRQWRAFVNTGAARPGLAFEFVSKKNKIKAAPLFVLCSLCSLAYLLLFFYVPTHRDYVVFQLAFWLAFVVVTMVDHAIFVKKEKRAKQIFGQFVAQLNATKQDSRTVDDKTVAQKIDLLKKQQPVSDCALEQASRILHENGLDDLRTAEEQKSINTALNGLLQAYSSSALKSV